MDQQPTKTSNLPFCPTAGSAEKMSEAGKGPILKKAKSSNDALPNLISSSTRVSTAASASSAKDVDGPDVIGNERKAFQPELRHTCSSLEEGQLSGCSSGDHAAEEGSSGSVQLWTFRGSEADDSDDVEESNGWEISAEGIFDCIILSLVNAAEALGRILWMVCQQIPEEPVKRSLIILFSWVLLGVYVYTSLPWAESDKYYTLVDAFYVMAQILTTVGYGDMCAQTQDHLFFTAFYVLIAVVAVSTVVGAVADRIVRQQENMLQGAIDNIEVDEVLEATDRLTDRVQHTLSRANVPSGASVAVDKLKAMLKAWAAACVHATEEQSEFFIAFFIWFFFVFVWILFFMFCPGEERDLITAFYMGVITLTSVGFGDKTPKTQPGKAFAALWMVLGVGAFANMVGKFSAAFLTQRYKIKELSHGVLEEIWQDGHFKRCQSDRGSETEDPSVQRNDFIVFMLERMNIVDENVIAKLSKNFDNLDADNNGFLNKSDIEQKTLIFPRVERSTRRLVTW